MTAQDLSVVAGQLGRPPRELIDIAVRCPFGYPAVIETAPFLAGAPNPTLFYLTCPALADAVSRIEAAGGVKRFRARAREGEGAATALERLTRWYRERRALLAGEQGKEARLEAGIGGPSDATKASCLHAYAAALLAAMAQEGQESDATHAAVNLGYLTQQPADSGQEPVARRRETAVAEQGRAAQAWIENIRQTWREELLPVDSAWCTDGRCSRYLAS